MGRAHSPNNEAKYNRRIIVFAQVEGRAGSSTSPQTRLAKFSYAADAVQLQHFSGPILASPAKPAEENETCHTLKNPQLRFTSACLAEAGGRRRRRRHRHPHPAAINVSVQTPIIRSSCRPLRSHSSRGPDPNALTVVPPPLQRCRGDATKHSRVSTLRPPSSPLDFTN